VLHPEKCRAAVVVEFGARMQILPVKVPFALEQGAILTRNLLATVCATDVHLLANALPPGYMGEPPLVLGHEVVGQVAEMNGIDTDAVGQDLHVGDRVVWTHGYCGRCRYCVLDHMPSLCANRRSSMAGQKDEFPFLGGGFAEYGYVFPTGGAIRVPEEISDSVASAASCAMQTVVHAYERSGGVDEGTVVVVQGAGPLGLFSVARYVAAGAKVIVVGGPAQRLELARAWGAEKVLDIDDMPSPSERVAWVMDMTGGRGGDIVVEASGVPAAFAEGMEMVAEGGRYVVVGQGHNVDVKFNPSMLNVRNIMITGVRAAAPHHTWRALEFLRRHRATFNWEKMITSTQGLDHINEAFERMDTWDEIKPAIKLLERA
jgi:L-iditol 2-dehydrogenase